MRETRPNETSEAPHFFSSARLYPNVFTGDVPARSLQEFVLSARAARFSKAEPFCSAKDRSTIGRAVSRACRIYLFLSYGLGNFAAGSLSSFFSLLFASVSISFFRRAKLITRTSRLLPGLLRAVFSLIPHACLAPHSFVSKLCARLSLFLIPEALACMKHTCSLV